MARQLTWPPGSTMMHFLPYWRSARTSCGKRANLSNWSTGFDGVTCRDCLAIADQSPSGSKPGTGFDAKHASGGAVRQSPELSAEIPSTTTPTAEGMEWGEGK